MLEVSIEINLSFILF